MTYLLAAKSLPPIAALRAGGFESRLFGGTGGDQVRDDRFKLHCGVRMGMEAIKVEH